MARLERDRRKNLLHREFDRRSKRKMRQKHWVSQLEQLEHRCVLATGPILAGITTNDGNVLSSTSELNEAPQELTFRFDENQEIDVSTLDAIRVLRSNQDGLFGDGNDIVITPGYVGGGSLPNDVVLRFAETLPDDIYRVEIDGSSASPLRNVQGEAFNDGADFAVQFNIDLGALIQAVVPQPMSRNPFTGQLMQARNQIQVYFNNDDLDPVLAVNPDFYQLIFTGHGNSFDPQQDTATNIDDGAPVKPSSVNYDNLNDVATLTFDVGDLSELGIGTYRLRIGTSETTPMPPTTLAINGDPGSSFASAWDVTTDLGIQGQVFQSSIEAQAYPLQFPGSNDDPGHRHVSSQLDLHVPNDSGDQFDGISTISYNFKDVYGQDPQGADLSNAITERQKTRTREIMELYGHYLGVQFVETADEGFTIVNGDIRAIDSTASPTLQGLSGDLENFGPTAVVNANATLSDEFGGEWFTEAMRQVGFLLGMGASLDLPEGTIMGGDPRLTFGVDPEPIFPSSNDIVHGQHLFRPDGIDIDMYRFTLDEPGLFSAEVSAERLSTPSHLDSHLRLYRQTEDGPELISQNDDYFSQDSFLELDLAAGEYFIGVSSKGNDQYDPTIENTGFGGTTQGDYELRLNHRPSVNNAIRDTSGNALDGDNDGQAGGVFNYWFRVQSEANTVYVDKSFAPGGNGNITSPFRSIQSAMDAAKAGDVVRVVGNRLGDGNDANDLAYEIGFDPFGQPLPDGGGDGILRVKPGVTLMFDAGAAVKLSDGAIIVGSTSASVDRSGAAMQVLGTPDLPVYFTSFNDDSIGVDNNPLPTQPSRGDWGGILFARGFDEDSGFDYEHQGIFLNYVNGADIRYGGGSVSLDSVRTVVNPISISDARPTITNNKVQFSADAAMSASPNAFEETNFNAPEFQSTRFTSDVSRVGPEIRGNTLLENTNNGLKILDLFSTNTGQQIIETATRWDDSDIVHIITENVFIQGQSGGQLVDPVTGQLTARLDASLVVDPGTVVKLGSSSIRSGLGATLIAEGDQTQPVVFTSILDDRYGGGGSFDTNGDNLDPIESDPSGGDWAGIVIGHTGLASIDHAVIAYGGGTTASGGAFLTFNAVELHQADARITNSRFEFNASGIGGLGPANRFGIGGNDSGTVFVRGSQPIIVDNVFVDNAAAVVSIDVNALNHELTVDGGRQTGFVETIGGFMDNHGPLVRGNQFDGNGINGMEVRGGTLTTESVWDDADIVHVLREGVYVPNFHSYGGLRLLSSTSQSLVVKSIGPDAGFTATGTALGIDDHIGGRIQVLGQPDRPVVLTSIFDDTVGAGFNTSGQFQTDTNNGGRPLSESGQFEINVNFGPNISLNEEAVAGVLEAVALWETAITDPVTVNIDIDFANLGAVGNRGNDLMQTTANTTNFTYDTVRSAMIMDAGPHETIVADVPNFTSFENNVRLPIDRTNPYAVSQSMQLTTANAKALGLIQDAATFSDGTILIHDDLTAWDFDRKDGLKTYREDIQTYLMREIGTILGFISSVDDVNAALNGAADRNIEVTPLDLFRFEPSQGSQDFANAPRVLDPRAENHVFYAGGDYDPDEWPVNGLRTGEIPLATGRFRFGELNDNYGAGYWHDEVFFRDEKLTVATPVGVMDPISRLRDEVNWQNDPFQTTVGVRIDMSEQDRLAFDVIGWDVQGPTPGDWDGISLERLTHDRNVLPVTEVEGVASNALPTTAHFVGTLAPSTRRGTDTKQIGFDISGLLSSPSDVDVYSFNATAGTQVWLDIDRTSSSLDTVLELVSASGQTLARSDNSNAEADQGVEILGGTLLGDDDLYSKNIFDPGMSVVLPGAIGSEPTYYVRVRSVGDDLTDLTGGKTEGAYGLQVRLQESDEISGTIIQFADIRYADQGINIVGPPSKSPLTGEHVEDESFNDHFNELSTPIVDDQGAYVDGDWLPDFAAPWDVEAQEVGNLLNSDLGAISIAGALTDQTDVDWYEFRVAYDGLLDQSNFSFGSVFSAGVVFDIDYADGLSRPNTALAVYDSSLNLMYYSTGSEIAADQQAGASVRDLSRGSFGDQDPFIGPVELSASSNPYGQLGDYFEFAGQTTDGIPSFFGNTTADFGTYYVAVSAITQVPYPIASGIADLTPVLGDTERGSRVDIPFVFDPDSPFFEPTLPLPDDPFFTCDTFGFGFGGFGLGQDQQDYCANPTAPGNSATTGEYQLEIRYVPVPEDGFTASDATLGDQNRERDQGQITITANKISHSLDFGINVEAAPRDLPTYSFFADQIGGSDATALFDFGLPRITPHNQFTTGDYATHAAPARNLITLNEERIVPGLTISNNVISENMEGGIHLAGEANGIVLQTYDLAFLTTFPDFDAGDIEGTEFTIWDQNRNAATFEFDNNGAVSAGHIPIKFDLDLPNDGIFFGGSWEQFTPPTDQYYVAWEIEHALRTSDLDIRTFRGDGNSIFIEGATEIGHPDVTSGLDSVFLPDDSFYPIITSFIPQQGPVTLVNVTNNTLVGRGGDLFGNNENSDVGLLLENNSSPTILNNVIANFGTAIEADLTSTDEDTEFRTFISGPSIDQSAFQDELVTERSLVQARFGADASFRTFTQDFGTFTAQVQAERDIEGSFTEYIANRATVIGSNLYQGNLLIGEQVTAGDKALLLSNSEPLFVDGANGNFLLAAGSRAIDSSQDSVDPRDGLASVLDAIGFEASPIQAPDNDANGLKRVDDPSVQPQDGGGANAFKDRGALERADFVGPTASLVRPLDNAGSDLNPQLTEVFLVGERPGEFLIQLSGPDDSTVDSSKITVLRGADTLVRGVDYRYSYDSTSDVIRLAPLVGAWPDDAIYTVLINNSVLDPSGNALQPNRADGTTRFDIAIGEGFDYGDAAASFPVTNAEDGARHRFSPNVFLGAGVDVDIDGQPSNDANLDGFDDGISFDTLLIPGAPAQFTVTASTSGMLSAWIDLNADGDWSDSGEGIMVNRMLDAGSNVIRIPSLPNSPALGDVFQVGVAMRFRFSTEVINSPSGTAADGEVEDYFVAIISSPWQNPENRFDVNDNGSVAPLDALLIINELNERSIGDVDTGQLPIPPVTPKVPDPTPQVEGSARYLDVNGDGYVSPVDALQVINALTPAAAAAPLGMQVAPNRTRAIDEVSFDNRSIDGELKSPDRPTISAHETVSDAPQNQQNSQRHMRRQVQRRALKSQPSADNSIWNGQEIEDALSDIAEDIAILWNRENQS